MLSRRVPGERKRERERERERVAGGRESAKRASHNLHAGDGAQEEALVAPQAVGEALPQAAVGLGQAGGSGRF